MNILTPADVTTESGRPAQIQPLDIQTTAIANNANAAVGGGAAMPGGTTVPASSALSIQPQTQALPFRPTVDVIPYVAEDKNSIQLTLIPTVTEFIGYDDPGKAFVIPTDINGTPITAVLPLPHFRLREIVSSVAVWDGQTVILGGPASPTMDKAGGGGTNTAMEKKRLLIFVTPTIVNPDGTRYHSPAEMSDAKFSVPPPQPAPPSGK